MKSNGQKKTSQPVKEEVAARKEDEIEEAITITTKETKTKPKPFSFHGKEQLIKTMEDDEMWKP